MRLPLPLLALAPLLFALPAPAAARSAQEDPLEQYRFLSGLADKGMHELVVREARAFLRDHPRDERVDLVRYRLAGALYELDRREEARDELRLLAGVRGFEFAAEVRFRLGQCELELGEPARAREAFAAVLAAGKNYLAAPATFLEAEAAFRAGDLEAADVGYGRLLGPEAPEGAEAHAADAAHGQVWCAFRLGRHGQTAERADGFLGRWPEDPRRGEVLFLAGEALLEADRPEEALARYREVPEGDLRDAALRGAGFALAELGRPAEAARTFRRLLEEHPESRHREEAALQAAVQHLAAGEPAEADELLGGGSAGRGPEVLYWRARAAADRDRHEAALALCERALEEAPEGELRSRLGVARGDALFELGRSAEAAAAYRDSGSVEAVQAGAVALLAAGRPAEAEALVRPLIERAGGEAPADARLVLAEALFAQQRDEEALPLFAALAGDGDPARSARAATREAWCLWRLGRAAEAAARFEALPREHPGSEFVVDAAYLAGRAHEDAGAPEAAGTAYAGYLRERGEGEHALEASLRLARLEPGAAGVRRLEQLLPRAAGSDLAPRVAFELAERLAAGEDHARACELYAGLLERHADSDLAPAAAYGLAWSRYRLGEFEDAAQVLGDLARREGVEPELALAGLELALHCARERGRPAEARELALRILPSTDDEPRRLAAARVAAGTLASAGDHAAARDLFAELLERTTDPATGLACVVERAYLALDQGDAAAAEGELRAAVEHAGADASLCEALFFTGEAWFDAADDGRAVAVYRLALEGAAPDVRPRLLYKLGFAELRRGEHAAAAEAFAALVRDHAGHALEGESLFLAGESLFRADRLREACAPLERLLEAHPRHAVVPKARFRLGVARARLGDHAAAREQLAELARRHPDFEARDEAELWRGRCLAALGERRAARSALTGVVQRDQGVLAARARIALGLLAEEAGELEDALAEYLKVSVLHAQEEEVGEALFRAGRLLEDGGDGARARSQYAELLERCPASSFAPAARERLDALGD